MQLRILSSLSYLTAQLLLKQIASMQLCILCQGPRAVHALMSSC